MNFVRLLLFLTVVIISLPAFCSEPDYSDLSEVLKIFEDSRLTRDLKNSGSAEARKAFISTLENKVYKPADTETVKYVNQLPEYEGKRIVTHDFRTPGDKGMSVNTDRDVRLLAEVEPGRWVEVPAEKWKDVYYKEFAKRTGYASSGSDNAAETAKIEAHAEKFRQLATDRFHMEASHDYSDYNLKDKSYRIRISASETESVSNISSVKSGDGLLINAESMAMMYFQKSWDQLRQAENTAAESLRNMHTAEALAQMKKGVETLDAVRESYRKQGYDIGKLPDNFIQAAEIIKSVQGTSATDVDGVVKNLQEHGFRNPAEFAENMRGQTESLKLAQKRVPRTPNLNLETSGKIAGFAGDVMSVAQRLKEAEQGSHLFWNFSSEDTKAERALKTAAVAAAELIPVPVIDALERGWKTAGRAEEYLEHYREHLERGGTGWEVHPAFIMFAVASTVTYETAASMTVDPLIAGGQAVMEGGRLAADAASNFLESFERAKSEKLQQEKKSAVHQRMAELDLGEIRGYRGSAGGRSLYDETGYGEMLFFQTDRNSKWTEAYFTKWELRLPDGRSIILRERLSAADASSAEASFAIPDGFPPGKYTVILRVYETGSLLQADWREKEFSLNSGAGIGVINAYSGNFPEKGGAILRGSAFVGDILAFEAAVNGIWDERYEVQWLVGGENYKTSAGNSENANRLRFDSTGMNKGLYEVAVRLIDISGNVRKIVSFGKVQIVLKEKVKKIKPFKISSYIDKYGGKPLPAYVQNGDTLAFQAEIEHPDSPEYAVLYWQVYDAAGRPVQGLSKQEQIYESGGVKKHGFMFRTEDLSDGDYTVGLTHIFASVPENRTQSSVNFHLAQSVRINEIWVSVSPDEKKHHVVIPPEKDAFLYITYSLGKGISKAEITLSTKDKSGRIIESVTAERPREGEKPPYRIGLLVPHEKIPMNENITFDAAITSSDGKKYTGAVQFSKESYKVVLNVPDEIQSGEMVHFSAKAPESFQQPLKISVQVGGGLTLGHVPGALNGTITGISEDTSRLGDLKISITDSAGRTASAWERIHIYPRQKAPETSAPAYTYTPPLSSFKPSVPPAPVQTPQAPKSSAFSASGSSADYTSTGKQRWAEAAEQILGRTVHSCFRTAAPQSYQQMRRILLNASVDHAAIGRMNSSELSSFVLEQEKKVAATVYNTLMQGGISGNCAESCISQLYSGGLISYSQVNAFKEKNKPKPVTVYWVVLEQSGTVSAGTYKPRYSARIVTGNAPPATGFSGRHPSSSAHYMNSTKAYGTLSRDEAQRIVTDIGSGRGSAVFARTSSDHIGIKWSGNPGTPLVTYGQGVQEAMRK